FRAQVVTAAANASPRLETRIATDGAARAPAAPQSRRTSPWVHGGRTASPGRRKRTSHLSGANHFAASGCDIESSASHTLEAVNPGERCDPFGPWCSGHFADPPPHATVQTVGTTAGEFFRGTVAGFSTGDANASADEFTALIQWGDGEVSLGWLEPTGTGSFDVV